MTRFRFVQAVCAAVLAVCGFGVLSLHTSASAGQARITILDQCDPATFNAALGPGACVPHAGDRTTFAAFLAEFRRDHAVDGWEFDPDALDVRAGQTVQLANRGGEFHTFTRVAAFGGGVIGVLNGTQAPRPECGHIDAQGNPVFAPFGPGNMPMPAGSTATLPVPATPKTQLYQCCIHPWMQAVLKTN